MNCKADLRHIKRFLSLVKNNRLMIIAYYFKISQWSKSINFLENDRSKADYW